MFFSRWLTTSLPGVRFRHGTVDGDALLAADPDFPAVTGLRFTAVVETEGAYVGIGEDGWDAAVLVKERLDCPPNYDWDASVWLDCPNHTGTFCPGWYEA